MGKMIAIVVCVLTGCASPLAVSTDVGQICTISDCPEGTSLAEMREGAVSVAYDDGADDLDRAWCTSWGQGTYTCYAQFHIPFVGNKTAVCDWYDCDWHGCAGFAGCQVVDGWMR